MTDPIIDDWDDDTEPCPYCGNPLCMDDCPESRGAECGRWNNGRLTSSCRKAGSEECDFECPYRGTLRF